MAEDVSIQLVGVSYAEPASLWHATGLRKETGVL